MTRFRQEGGLRPGWLRPWGLRLRWPSAAPCCYSRLVIWLCRAPFLALNVLYFEKYQNEQTANVLIAVRDRMFLGMQDFDFTQILDNYLILPNSKFYPNLPK